MQTCSTYVATELHLNIDSFDAKSVIAIKLRFGTAERQIVVICLLALGSAGQVRPRNSNWNIFISDDSQTLHGDNRQSCDLTTSYKVLRNFSGPFPRYCEKKATYRAQEHLQFAPTRS